MNRKGNTLNKVSFYPKSHIQEHVEIRFHICQANLDMLEIHWKKWHQNLQQELQITAPYRADVRYPQLLEVCGCDTHRIWALEEKAVCIPVYPTDTLIKLFKLQPQNGNVSILVIANSVKRYDMVHMPILNWEARRMRSNCIMHLPCSEDDKNAEAETSPKSLITPLQVGWEPRG